MSRRRISTKERASIFLAAGGRCHLCGGVIGATEGYDIEHVIPLAQGGEDGGDNLRPAHRKCHKTKTADDAANTARARRREANHRGWKAPSTRPLPFGKRSAFKKKLDGTIVRRDA